MENYTAENWPYGLIREYNGADFVYNDSKQNLPYNPQELVLIATDSQWNIFREWDTIKVDNIGNIYKNETILYSWTADLELFFSDGSVSILEKDSQLTLTKLNFPKENNLTTFVKLTLQSGKIWTKATSLNDESEFQVSTTDSTAAVRWTIFSVAKDINGTTTQVIIWKVEVTQNQTQDSKEITDKQSIKTTQNSIDTPATIQDAIIEEFQTNIKFSTNTAIRTADEIASLIVNNEDWKVKEIEQIEKYNCMFEWEEIQDWTTITAYKNKEVPAWSTCQSRTKTCVKWNIEWDNTFKYNSCVVLAPNQCPIYNEDLFNSSTPTNKNTSIDIEKTTTLANWNITYKRNVTCNTDLTYTVNSNTIKNLSCNTWYQVNASWDNCEAVPATCTIWWAGSDLTNIWTEVGSDCIYTISSFPLNASSKWIQEFNLESDGYIVKINWNPITLISWKNYWDEIKFKWNNLTKVFLIQNNWTNIYLDWTLINLTKIEIIKATWGVWAGWTPTVHLWCGDCPSWTYYRNEKHTLRANWDDIQYCSNINLVCRKVHRKRERKWVWKNETWTY